MNKGRIIFLNGVTSSGKTSIVEALQAWDDVFFYVVANDLFQEMVGEKFLQENYWKYIVRWKFAEKEILQEETALRTSLRSSMN